MKISLLPMLTALLLLVSLTACGGDTEEPIKEEVNDMIPPPAIIENSFRVQDAFPGVTFTRPLGLENAKDDSGRIFVVEQAGYIYVLSGPEAAEKELFLDVRALVDDSGNEMGLLGLAFHPHFAQNGYFYINYTDASGTVVARYTADGNRADPGSHHVILTFDQPFRNHNGGQIAFGPDGFLYIAAGDGGSGGDPQGHGQNRQTLLGSILRIDVDRQDPGLNYAIPADNPWAGNRSGYREEIYAYGLRNPWRFSFDPPTERLWAADVGQNRVEEINLIEKGKNYGWNIMEGSDCFNPPQGCDPSGLELPVYEYRHPLGRSVTGGYVYRGTGLPMLEGIYVYGDFVTGLIWGLHLDDEGGVANYTLAQTGLNITSFGQDEDNELYLTAFDGKIYRLAAE